MTAVDGREVTAFHEAGHAVAFLSRGHGFRYVTIRPRNRAYAGTVAINGPRRVRSEDAVEIAYAGAWAETRLTWPGPAEGITRPDDVMDDEGLTFSDHFLARLAFGGGCHDFQSVRHLLNTWDVTTFHMSSRLETYWPSITAIAEALLASPRALTFRQVLEVVEARLIAGTDWERI